MGFFGACSLPLWFPISLGSLDLAMCYHCILFCSCQWFIYFFLSPSQGLRQGDPLSPYLFVLCVDILSSMIGTAKDQGLIDGIQISRLGPSITHLLFADDSFLFLKVSDSGISTIHSILNSYCQLSGQVVNFQKSSIFLSPNSPPSLPLLLHFLLPPHFFLPVLWEIPGN